MLYGESVNDFDELSVNETSSVISAIAGSGLPSLTIDNGRRFFFGLPDGVESII